MRNFRSEQLSVIVPDLTFTAYLLSNRAHSRERIKENSGLGASDYVLHFCREFAFRPHVGDIDAQYSSPRKVDDILLKMKAVIHTLG